MDTPLVAITGVGVVTSLGAGVADNWQALTAGRSGIHTISRFPIDGLRTTIAGTVDFLEEPFDSSSDRSTRMAELVAEEAIATAGIDNHNFPGPLFMAVPPVELEWPHRIALANAGRGKGTDDWSYERLLDGAGSVAGNGQSGAVYRSTIYAGIAERTADRFGTKGAPISLSTACASGGTAVQLSVEAIRRGDCQAALCIGTDGSVNPEALVRFSLLSALSTQNDPANAASKPFSSNRDGFVMAEGAGAIVLENLDHARARGAKILGFVRGIGEKADDFHRTRSKPDGSAVIGAIRKVLDDAGMTPDAIDYVNAHGTATPENDKMECMALESVFGDRITDIAVSSNKSMIGHTITAAGAVEAVFSLLTIQNGRIPPTINYTDPDPTIPLDVVPNVARDAPVEAVMSNSFGFGGQNVCLIVTAP